MAEKGVETPRQARRRELKARRKAIAEAMQNAGKKRRSMKGSIRARFN